MGRRKKRVSGHTGWIVWGKKSRRAEVNPRQLGSKKNTKAEALKEQTKWRKKGFVANAMETYPGK